MPKKKKKRKAERHPDEQGRNDRQPNQGHWDAARFTEDENKENERGNDDVEAKERADPGREQFLAKEGKIEAVVHYPRQELPVGQSGSDDAEDEIHVAQSHAR